MKLLSDLVLGVQRKKIPGQSKYRTHGVLPSREIMPKRVDANQKDIVKGLRAIGAIVACTHEVGKGFPDIVVAWKGENYLFEIKDPNKPKSQRKLTEDELDFHLKWQQQGQVDKIESVHDALIVMGEVE